jgi:hypothetical protein
VLNLSLVGGREVLTLSLLSKINNSHIYRVMYFKIRIKI